MFLNLKSLVSKTEIPLHIIFMLCSLPLLAGVTALPAQNYVWPTTASRLMTSSFCEFRPRHYHAALDIKTWNRTGYKVFAIEDGYVMRVRVSSFGYGKAVYLKLRDGKIVVYGHLERFRPDLERFVNAYRREHQSYRADIYLKSGQFPVRRGQVVGYSGRTGIGVPHLHFEMRNSKNEPINPLPYYRDFIEDRIAPEFYEAAFVPLDQKSLVNMQPDTAFYDLFQSSNVTLPDTLILSGKTGVNLKVYDRANGARNLFSFYQAKMWVDDSLVYAVKYDRFSYAQTKLIEIDKSFSLWRKGRGIFHHFYRHPANRLPHYDGFPAGAGILNADSLTEGLHTLRIEAEDFWRNKAVFTASFLSGNPRPLDYDLFRWMDSTLYLRIQSPVKLDAIRVARKTDAGGWQAMRQLKRLGEMHYQGKYNYAISVLVQQPQPDNYIRVRAETDSGIATFPLYIPPVNQKFSSGETPVFHVRQMRIKQDRVELTVASNRYKPYRFLKGLQQKMPGIFWFPAAEQVYRVHIPASYFGTQKSILRELFGTLPQYPEVINPAAEGRLVSADGLFRADYPVNALYQETAVYLADSTTGAAAVPSFEAPYYRVGKIYDLQPFDQPVNTGIRVSLTAPDSAAAARGLGLYYLDPKHGWTFIPASQDPQKTTFTARVTSMEKFTLARDTVPPVLLPAQRISGGILHSRNGYLTFVVKDEMSGIQKESQIEVLVNGRWTLFDYDPEEDIVTLRLPAAKSGVQKLQIRVVDNSGNVTTATYRVQ